VKPPKRVQMKVGEFYTLQGAAKALGLSYWTVYRYVRIAGIPTRQISNLTLVKLEDLRELGTPLEGQRPAEAAVAETRERAAEGADNRPVADSPHPDEMGPLPDLVDDARMMRESIRLIPRRRIRRARLVRIQEIDRPLRSH
jgi:hypothetical protein